MIDKIKKWKGEIFKTAKRWEILRHKVFISRDSVIIKHYNESEFKAFFFCFALPITLISSIFLILIYYEVTSNNVNIFALIFYISFIFPFYLVIIIGFKDLFWNKETEWNIDFINQNITLSRIRPNFKQLKRFRFSDVKYLLYEGGMISYIVSFHICRFKSPVFFEGMKAQCEVLGKILSKNIQRNLYYRDNRISKKEFVI